MIEQIKENIWQMHFQEFGSCVYLIKLPQPILIDVSSKAAKPELLADLKELYIEPEDVESIILTHSHYDHNENLDTFPNAKVYSFTQIKEIEQTFPDFKVIPAPGHTRDSICILYDNVLFSGDAIFDKQHNYVGRTDLPESNPQDMEKTLEILKKVKYDILCAGHLV